MKNKIIVIISSVIVVASICAIIIAYKYKDSDIGNPYTSKENKASSQELNSGDYYEESFTPESTIPELVKNSNAWKEFEQSEYYTDDFTVKSLDNNYIVGDTYYKDYYISFECNDIDTVILVSDKDTQTEQIALFE